MKEYKRKIFPKIKHGVNMNINTNINHYISWLDDLFFNLRVIIKK